MSLENYLLSESKAAQEIRWDFRPEEVSQLYSLLKGLGYERYLDFVRRSLKDILRYISLSPSQRTQKKWINHPDALLLRFASLQIAEITLKFLRDSVGASRIVDHDSYRKFHTVFANALAPLLLDPELLRSFPFEGFDNPF